jgi:pimeloyl-ACP methyl ester carboxylesterase
VIPSDDAATKPDPLVTDVVFVIHGIRDEGFWTHKIARKVRALGERDREEREKLGKPPRKWATETSSYGYFAMLPFLLPFKRRHKVEWMMDQYAEALARYPSATFHYVGHSHGTYLLAKALKLYPSCRFGRVVFAGSVVACGYEWNTAVNRRQVEHVLNFVATTDWVVAFFPKLFEFVPIQDLGSAGHDGFRPYPQNGITQFTFVRGGHSAAIKEELWNTIAEFVSAEKPVVQKPERALTSPRSWWVVALGWFPFAVWLGIVAVIGLIVYWINLGNHTPAEVWTAGASTVVFIFLVLFILRRV